jgi:hypothetical protein
MDRIDLLNPWFWARAGSIYLVVAVIAGGIAYLGNHLGRKIGKKRLSVLGMRPRDTSNFITAVTGSLIAVATLTLFAVVSEEVRGVITGIARLKGELRRLQVAVDRANYERIKGRMVWGVGEPILQGALQPDVPPRTQRIRILAALDMANAVTLKRNNDIARKEGDEPLDPSYQLLVWDDAELQRLAETTGQGNKVVGLRILADQNCLYKDKVPVRLEVRPVSRIFKENEVVASRELIPENPEMLREWYAFLEAIRETALRRGMIEVNDSLGGGLSSADLDRLILDIKRLQGPGKLVAVAKYDLYQTSALAIRIEVRPGP